MKFRKKSFLLHPQHSEVSQYFAAIEKEYVFTKKGRIAEEQISEELKLFLNKYNERKAKLGLNTQQEAAEIMGISRRYISQLERGKHRPQFKTLKKLADGLGVEISYFCEKY